MTMATREAGGTTERIDVLVVGAGPTGLTLACDLVRRGVRARIIDAAEHGFSGSRAKGLQPRTLEVLHDLGVLDEVAAHATSYPLLGIHVGPLTLPWAMIRRRKASEDVPYPNTLLVAQSDTDACLRRRLGELGGHVEPNTRLLSYEQADEGVVATVEGPGGEELIHTRFVVGADGGGSTVRKQANIGFVGSTDESDRWIVADVIVDGLARNRWHVWPRNAGRLIALCPLPGGTKFQLMIRLRPDEDAGIDRTSIDHLVHGVSGRAGVRVRDVSWASVFRPNVRLVERYRVGNVFLAGDAAHVHPPTGAQGLNTGVQDAYNLGWKLGQVIAGAPDALLDSYEAERRPVAAGVLGLSSELYKGLTDRPLAAAKRGDEERQLKLSYRGGPLARNQGDHAGPLHAGDRAPDALYTEHDRHAGRLFDALRGPHFTLLAVGDAAIEGLDQIAWPQHGAALKTVQIPTAAPGLSRTYGLDGPAHILIRPDGYIAYIATRGWASKLAQGAAAMAPPYPELMNRLANVGR
jgi:2-polyprenyl-6-methoxyphenol hydroxylase-like FAD-dependent oxidoreductase